MLQLFDFAAQRNHVLSSDDWGYTSRYFEDWPRVIFDVRDEVIDQLSFWLVDVVLSTASRFRCSRIAPDAIRGPGWVSDYPTFPPLDGGRAGGVQQDFAVFLIKLRAGGDLVLTYGVPHECLKCTSVHMIGADRMLLQRSGLSAKCELWRRRAAAATGTQ